MSNLESTKQALQDAYERLKTFDPWEAVPGVPAKTPNGAARIMADKFHKTRVEGQHLVRRAVERGLSDTERTELDAAYMEFERKVSEVAA